MARPKQKINIMKLAEEAGVSHMTVSRVLNNRAGVSEQVRSQILALQEKYKFTTKYQGNKIKISVVITDPGITDNHKRLINTILQSCRLRDIEVTTVLHDPKSLDLVRKIRDLQCSGLIIPLGGYYTNQIPQLLKSKLPIVMIDTHDVADGIGYIDNDSYAGAYEITRYLLKMGHQRIGFLHYKHNYTENHIQRYNAYCNAMQDAGLELKKDFVVSRYDLGDVGQTDSNDSMEPVIESFLKQRTTAIIVVDDSLALSVMGCLQRKGIKIPDDISVTGFDNHSDSAKWFPALTTVNHDLEKAADIAVEAIAYAIAHPGKWNLPRETLSTSLVLRDSVKDLNKK